MEIAQEFREVKRPRRAEVETATCPSCGGIMIWGGLDYDNLTGMVILDGFTCQECSRQFRARKHTTKKKGDMQITPEDLEKDIADLTVARSKIMEQANRQIDIITGRIQYAEGMLAKLNLSNDALEAVETAVLSEVADTTDEKEEE